MKLVYKTYGDTPNLENAPAAYPAVCLELADDADVPAGFTVTTVAELEALKQSLATEYNAWLATLPTEG